MALRAAVRPPRELRIGIRCARGGGYSRSSSPSPASGGCVVDEDCGNAVAGHSESMTLPCTPRGRVQTVLAAPLSNCPCDRQTRLPHAVQNAVRDDRRHPVARAGDRRQCGDLLAVQRDAARAAAGAAPRAAGQLRRTPARSHGSQLVHRPATATRSSATRCSAISRRRNTAFSGIAGHMLFGVNLALPGQTPINGDGIFVSGSYFPVLGIQPALGRLFARTTIRRSADTTSPCSATRSGRTQLGGDPAVVGQQITVNGQQLTIVGVAPRGFQRHHARRRARRVRPAHHARRHDRRDGRASKTVATATGSTCSARLKPGATMEQAPRR